MNNNPKTSPRLMGIELIRLTHSIFKKDELSLDEKNFLVKEIQDFQKTGNSEKICSFIAQKKETIIYGAAELAQILEIVGK